MRGAAVLCRRSWQALRHGSAALLCLLFTIALIVLGDLSHDLAGASEPFAAIARGSFDAARAHWGLLLAGEIVRCVFAGAILLRC